MVPGAWIDAPYELVILEALASGIRMSCFGVKLFAHDSIEDISSAANDERLILPVRSFLLHVVAVAVNKGKQRGHCFPNSEVVIASLSGRELFIL